MASEELREKWGTVFMGERETSVEKLDAMQEPLRRERRKREQQEEYLENVRARAADRAREILGAAYAERQRILEEAKAEGEEIRRKLLEEGEQLKKSAKAVHDEIAAELARAKQVHEEAEHIRQTAHSEGFQNGMDQAGEELKELRAGLADSLVRILRAIDEQRKDICAGWREEIVELVKTAVAAGTGWLLESEHSRILRSLTLNALNLLEDRSTVTVRVNPEDEERVGELFAAARERAPELTQWIVSGDTSVERGGLTVECAAGSVDCRREHYREMVETVLDRLTLPARDGEDKTVDEVSDLVEAEVAKLAALMPAPEPESASEPESESEPAPAPEPEAALASEPEPEPAAEPEMAPESASQTVPAIMPEPGPEQSSEPSDLPPEDPTFAELEEELLPLEDGIKV
jgi:flagellar biosynthesis/type III secretory pathway protein FliH